jgi:phage terminase large subunit-like protein
VTTAALALDLLAALVGEDGRRWGDAAVPEQWEDARAVLDPSGQPYHFMTRARGFAKTSDLAGIGVAAMLAQLPAASRLYGLAADRDQGRLLVDSIAGYAARTPELGSALIVDAYKVTAANGSVLEVLPADAPGAYGLRPAFAIVDELSQWSSTAGPRRLWEAVSSAMAKVPGSRLVVLTSAGDPSRGRVVARA